MKRNRSFQENKSIQMEKGLSQEVVEKISHLKNEPRWMLNFRLNALKIFNEKSIQKWGPDLSEIDFDEMIYYSSPAEMGKTNWKDVPAEIKDTFEKLGIPQAEREYFSGVKAQFDSEVAYSSLIKEMEKQGVIFLPTDEALHKYPQYFKEFFGKIISPADNKFAALNSAAWSGGSFVYIPKGVKVERPLQAYFRINAERFGQFERTLIIVDEGAEAHYVEGCSAPIYSTKSLHAGVVEIIVKKGGKLKYTTVQNWSDNVYNLVTKRAWVEADGLMEWVDGNLGSKTTMKYPSCMLVGERARGEMLSISFADKGQNQDTGAKMIHLAPNTFSNINSRSISKNGGRSTFRGMVGITKGAKNAKANMKCHSLILDDKSSADSFPSIKVDESTAAVTHEATISRIDEEKLYYLKSRGLNESEAVSLVVLGFIEPISSRLPLEYAIELNRFMEIKLEEK